MDYEDEEAEVVQHNDLYADKDLLELHKLYWKNYGTYDCTKDKDEISFM